MRTTHLVNAWGTVINRIRNCRQISRTEDNTDKEARHCIRTMDRTCMVDRNSISIWIGRSAQSVGTSRTAGENRLAGQIPCAYQDLLWALWTNFGNRIRVYSRHNSVYALFISKLSCRILHSGDTYYDSLFPIRPASVHFRAALVHPPSARGAGQQISEYPEEATSYKEQAQCFSIREAIIANRHPSVQMERPEQCFHCRDLQAEFEEVRAQQRTLEDHVRSMEARHADQVRTLEAKLDEQCRILHEKYRAEMNLFLHRVHSLHEQFSNLSNRCAHAEESITVLRYMMENKFKEVSSSSSAKPNEPDPSPEDSTARKISHIEID